MKDGEVVSLDVGLSISTATGSVPIGRVSKSIMIFVVSLPLTLHYRYVKKKSKDRLRDSSL